MLAGFSLMKMLGSMAAFVGNAAMGAVHDATGTFTVPFCLMGVTLLLGALLTLTFKEPGELLIHIPPPLCACLLTTLKTATLCFPPG